MDTLWTMLSLVSLKQLENHLMKTNLFVEFIDLQKAFDTVDHGILLSKLNHYGVQGASYQWFKSYLTGTQYTTITHQKSHLCNIKYGAIQGSALGPQLFLLYISDFNQAILPSKAHHFDDDNNFYVLVIFQKN